MKVFISYCREPNVSEAVLNLANRLNINGVDCSVDQYYQDPKMGWQKWMDNEIESSDYVLVVCTKNYLSRSKNQDHRGKGVQFESLLLYNEIFQHYSENQKFLPVILTKTDVEFIPKTLQPFTIYNIEDEQGFEQLYRRLTNQPNAVKPKVGQVKNLSMGENLT